MQDDAKPMTIEQLRAGYAAGGSVRAVVERVLGAIAAARSNPVWISVMPRERLLERAAALDGLDAAARARLPLFGIPFAIKDNIDCAGLPTTAACPAFAYEPPDDAAVVARLVAAGAIPVGKTNLDQFATGLVGTRSPYGAVRNAIDPAWISGGSSSGSAVAVALGQVAFALGTDTAGSGRVPAAFNGLVGLKPTRGLLSTRGVVPACRTLDCVSVFARSVADAVAVRDVAAAFDPADPFSRSAVRPAIDAAAFRFGVPREAQLEFHGDTGYARCFRAAAAAIRRAGGRIVEIDFAPFLDAQALLYDGPWIAERQSAVGPFARAHPEALHPVTARVLASGAAFTAVDAFEAQYRLAALRRETEAVWASVDALLLPAAPTIYTVAELEANPVELNSRLGRYTNFANLLDLCALNLPAGSRVDGMPFGVSLLAPAFQDRRIAAVAARLELLLAGTGSSASLAAGEPAGPERPVRLAVVGAHLSGMPLNHQLTDRAAKLVRATRTSASYRLYALTDQVPPKPGLVRCPEPAAGGPVDVEVWALSEQAFGAFVAEVPPPLCIGTVELADGERVKGFLCESHALAGREDITALGGWRRFVERSAATADCVGGQQ
jgi:allophanate hydrolase